MDKFLCKLHERFQVSKLVRIFDFLSIFRRIVQTVFSNVTRTRQRFPVATTLDETRSFSKNRYRQISRTSELIALDELSSRPLISGFIFVNPRAGARSSYEFRIQPLIGSQFRRVSTYLLFRFQRWDNAFSFGRHLDTRSADFARQI